jgi:hypothetical protein
MNKFTSSMLLDKSGKLCSFFKDEFLIVVSMTCLLQALYFSITSLSNSSESSESSSRSAAFKSPVAGTLTAILVIVFSNGVICDTNLHLNLMLQLL